MKAIFRLACAFSLAAAPAFADCPAAVTAAAKKAYPDATVRKCKAEDGNYEVKLKKKDGSKLELDISAKGEILQTEEVIPVASLPKAVTAAFAKKYPKMVATKAEKQVRADKSVSFEVAFKTDKGKKEAMFKADGTFVEEE
jgi:biopolymer transport protein ExbD